MIGADARRFARFALVGVASNVLVFGLYLGATRLGVVPVGAATIAWVVGVMVAFIANRAWTFGYGGARSPAFLRYAALYATAYVLDIVLLVVLVDGAELPHAPVQAVLIVLFGIGLYLAQRSWVFREELEP